MNALRSGICTPIISSMSCFFFDGVRRPVRARRALFPPKIDVHATCTRQPNVSAAHK